MAAVRRCDSRVSRRARAQYRPAMGLVMSTTSRASYCSVNNGSMDDLTVATLSGKASRDGAWRGARQGRRRAHADRGRRAERLDVTLPCGDPTFPGATASTRSRSHAWLPGLSSRRIRVPGRWTTVGCIAGVHSDSDVLTPACADHERRTRCEFLHTSRRPGSTDSDIGRDSLTPRTSGMGQHRCWSWARN